MRKPRIIGIAMLASALTLSGVAAATGSDAEPTGASPVTATFEYLEGGPTKTAVLDDGGTRIDARWTFEAVEASDPRLEGVSVSTSTQDTRGGLDYFVSVVELRNDGGSWRQQPLWTLADGPHSGVRRDTVWVGEGGYDGLLLLAGSTFDAGTIVLDGHIIEADLLPVPGEAIAS